MGDDHFARLLLFVKLGLIALENVTSNRCISVYFLTYICQLPWGCLTTDNTVNARPKTKFM